MKARTKDGAEIFYELYDFTDPWKPAETILLHHGGRGNHKQSYKWIPLLSGHYRTIALDARGRGNSTIPPEDHKWSVERFASDVVAILDDAEIDRVHFVGNSFGSIVGENFAANHPDRIRTLSLLAPTYRWNVYHCMPENHAITVQGSLCRRHGWLPDPTNEIVATCVEMLRGGAARAAHKTT